MRPITRRERRAERQQRYAAASEVRLTERLDCTVSGESGARRGTAHEAPLPGWLRHLDYKTSGETGAMRVPTKAGKWLPGRQPRAPGAGRNTAGPVRVLAAQEAGALPQAIGRGRCSGASAYT